MIRRAAKHVLLWCCLLCIVTACADKPSQPAYVKYQADFTELFDTHTRFIYYASSEREFDHAVDIVQDELERMHRCFDIYHDYEGINNIKTINDNAGVAPVQVSDDIIALLALSREAYDLTGGTVNVTMGPVLQLWHTYRAAALTDPARAAAPPADALREAARFTDIDKLMIDEVNRTVFLAEAGMSLNVGAIAKGFAAQRAVETLQRQGVSSCLINMGGNVAAAGKPDDGVRARWSVSVQDPSDTRRLLDTVFINDLSVVTSGDYQRYFLVGAKRYGHIIDPATQQPAERFRAVTVAHEDSAVADALSTALFILPYENGRALAEASGAAVIWVNADGTVFTNERYNRMSQVYGGNNAVD